MNPDLITHYRDKDNRLIVKYDDELMAAPKLYPSTSEAKEHEKALRVFETVKNDIGNPNKWWLKEYYEQQ